MRTFDRCSGRDARHHASRLVPTNETADIAGRHGSGVRATCVSHVAGSISRLRASRWRVGCVVPFELLPEKWKRQESRSLFFQAAGASDRAAAQGIFVILSILLIPSPAVPRTGRDADSRDDARREETAKGKRQDGQDCQDYEDDSGGSTVAPASGLRERRGTALRDGAVPEGSSPFRSRSLSEERSLARSHPPILLIPSILSNAVPGPVAMLGEPNAARSVCRGDTRVRFPVGQHPTAAFDPSSPGVSDQESESGAPWNPRRGREGVQGEGDCRLEDVPVGRRPRRARSSRSRPASRPPRDAMGAGSSWRVGLHSPFYHPRRGDHPSVPDAVVRCTH